MRVAALLLAVPLVFYAATAAADVPEDLKSAAESADGVIVGLVAGYGSGAFPHVEVWVLDVLKGPDPGEKLAVTLPRGTDTMKTLKKHGDKYIIAYRGPGDEKGRYAYAGPKFDTPEIIATPENADKVKPGSFRLTVPTFEQAVIEADAVALAVYTGYNPKAALSKLSFQVIGILKGSLPERNITVTLEGRYLHWLTSGGVGSMQEKINPLLTQEPRILILRKAGRKLYYAGPEFTSPCFRATRENVAEVRRLAEASYPPIPESQAPPPVANFYAESICGKLPFTVRFFETCAGHIEGWQWDFDNDSKIDSTMPNPIHIYSEPGTYTVTLAVTGPGGSDREAKTNYITVVVPSRADFTASPTSGSAPLAVQFHDRSNGRVMAWQWDFDNDGTVDSKVQNPEHTYSAAGIYTVNLTVSGPTGNDTKTKTDFITVSWFDWTWWIVGAAAVAVALIAALLISKIDYKYDRRRERLESRKKLRRGAGADSDTESGRPEK